MKKFVFENKNFLGTVEFDFGISFEIKPKGDVLDLYVDAEGTEDASGTTCHYAVEELAFCKCDESKKDDAEVFEDLAEVFQFIAKTFKENKK